MYPYDQNFQNQIANMLVGNATQQPQAAIHTVKVNGRGGAESYNMPPNSDALLLDMNDPIIWFVQTDGAGYKTLTPYDITPHKEVSQQDRFNELDERIKRLEEAVNGKSNFRPNESRQHNDAGSRGNAQG